MKKNIAFVISKNELELWKGGQTYFKNLLNYTKYLQQFNFIIYTDSKNFIKKQKYNVPLNIVELDMLKKNKFIFFLRKLIILIFKRDLIFFLKMRKDNINVLSHRHLFKNKYIKVISWIPDLQHKVFPNFFKKRDLSQREAMLKKQIKNSDQIFVSSNQVKKEFKKYYNLTKKIIPLKVVSFKNNLIVKKKMKNYILFPSQYWSHKNHYYLLDVAKKIKLLKLPFKFVFCGKIYNHGENIFEKIKIILKKENLNRTVLLKGELTDSKLNKLQQKCKYFINPSFYEGWSTINEEARELGKIIFLSKINGHIEQNNPGSIYFNLSNSDDLINKLLKINKYNKKLTLKYLNKKKQNFKKNNLRDVIRILNDKYKN